MSTSVETMSIFYTATNLIRLFRKITSNTGRIGLTRCAIFWLRYHQPVCSSSYASASKKPIHSSYVLTDGRGAPTVCLCLWYGNVSSPCGGHSFYPCAGYDSHIYQILRVRLSYIHSNHRCETLYFNFVILWLMAHGAIFPKCDLLFGGGNTLWLSLIHFAVISSTPGRCRTYRLRHSSRTEDKVAPIGSIATCECVATALYVSL